MPPDTKKRQPGGDDVSEQCGGRRCDGARRDQRGQILGGRPKHPQRQAGAADGDRWQHRMQPDREAAGAEPGELTVHPRLRVVEAATRGQRQPLRQTPHSGFVSEPNIGAPQAVSVIDPHRVRRGDQHIGRAVCAQQWLEDPGAGQLGLQYSKVAQQLGVAEHPAGFGPDRVGHHRGPQRGGFRRQPLTHPVDQRTGHAALLSDLGRRVRRQHSQHSAGRRRQRRASRQSQTAVFELLGQPRVRPHRRQQRHAGDRSHLVRPQPARRRSPNDQPDIGIDAGKHRRDRRGGRTRPHIARADHDDEIGCVQGSLSSVGQTARNVADHGRPATAAGIDDGVHRSHGVQLVSAPGARQHADPAMARQRLAHRRPIQPSALQRQVGPAHARVVSPPTSRSMPPPQGSRSTSSGIGGGLCQRGSEQ